MCSNKKDGTFSTGSQYLSWVGCFSKDYKQISRYFDSEKSDEIIFAGPAKTYDEVMVIFEELDF